MKPAANMSVPLRATYRVQLHGGFGFAPAAELASYLAALGVSHVYCSPYLQAGKGSTHGYDVVDHGRVNEELGGAPRHKELCAALREAGLGQILDIVPNHMSIAEPENAWWRDVLENGPSSRYASYFDVDWQAPDARMQNMILLPVLEDHYGRVLEADKFRLERVAGSVVLRYHEKVFPLSPRSLDEILRRAVERHPSDTLAFIADSCAQLPLSTATDYRSVRLRHRDKEVLRELLTRLCQEDRATGEAIDAVLAELMTDREALDALLDRQNYRLAFWRTAGYELDYRRFFDITSLASLRTEDPQVFAETHALVLQWVREGVLDGLRVDHPDGLRDPNEYFTRLAQSAPQAWIVVEKILGTEEALPNRWPVAGTTGYDFLNRAGGLLIDPAGEQPLTEFYAKFTGESVDYRAIVREKKHLMLRELFVADVNRLVALLGKICETNRRYRDYTRRELSAVLRETIASFPVYRSYVRAALGEVGPDDERYINLAIDDAKQHRPDIDGDLFDFLRDILLLKVRGELETELVMRFQQHTGPVMAKGVEDTTFYSFNRLVSLNEVGGDPGRWGFSLDEFHESCRVAQAEWPWSMLASTTHDTKRNEDVRARISLLSEIPERWAEAVRRWTKLAERHRRGEWPDRNMEYFLYQTLLGAWPIELERMLAYAQKAMREAKVHTSWTNPVAEYETAVREFLTGLLADREFLAAFEPFVAELVPAGRINSLAQTLIKLTSPGIPDIYQGTELWALSLVDPDNRRPVDYDVRKRLLAALDATTPEQVMARSDEGLPKLWLIRQSLALRARLPEAFGDQGAYEPLRAEGPRAAHVVAFRRGDAAITIAPRWPLKLAGDWQGTSVTLPAGKWVNQFTGETVTSRVRMAELLKRFPVALLAK